MAVVVISNIIIVSSYALNLFNVINLSSSLGWPEAVSACGSHIITAAMFFWIWSACTYQNIICRICGSEEIFSIVYMFFLPLLNPFFYSLWNKDVKLALK